MKGLQALVFDFDGLICDTESLDFLAWSEVFASYGARLEMDRWLEGVGAGPASWSVTALLAEAAPGMVDPQEAQALALARHAEMAQTLVPRKGIVDWLDFLRVRSIPYAIASSSEMSWVDHHLKIIGLRERFGFIVTRDQVERAKPFPDLYQEACRRLGVEPERTAAFEDSENGITAAKEAGLFAVAIPGPITARLRFERANLRAEEPSDVTWDEMQRAFSMAN